MGEYKKQYQDILDNKRKVSNGIFYYVHGTNKFLDVSGYDEKEYKELFTDASAFETQRLQGSASYIQQPFKYKIIKNVIKRVYTKYDLMQDLTIFKNDPRFCEGFQDVVYEQEYKLLLSIIGGNDDLQLRLSMLPTQLYNNIYSNFYLILDGDAPVIKEKPDEDADKNDDEGDVSEDDDMDIVYSDNTNVFRTGTVL